MDLEKYLPGAASITEQLDTRLLLVLRDGRNLIGTLRTFDQFTNLVLENTIERVIYEDCFCDLPLGLFIVRGDNVVVFGEIDEEKEKSLPLKEVTQEELREKITATGDKKAVDWDLE